MMPLLLALVAAMAPVTTAIYAWLDGQAKLKLAQSAQRSALREKYLERYLDQKLPDAERKKILVFLVDVDEDPQLKEWARKRLETTEKTIKTKSDLYQDMIATVAALANVDLSPGVDTIRPESRDYRHFWELYQRDLLQVESRNIESLMVSIGEELRRLQGKPPSDTLKQLSYRLARAAKDELGER